MSYPYFIKIASAATTGSLGALPRAVVLVTRETVTGFSPDTATGLIRINKADRAAFETANPTSRGLINALRTVFAGSISYDYVYILSAPSGVTTAQLDTANSNPRAWMFLTVVSVDQGRGVDETPYLDDVETCATWASTGDVSKIVVHTYSPSDPTTMPTRLAAGGSIQINNNVKTVINNRFHTITGVDCYDNVALGWLSYCIASAVSRSWGSLSDAHDFAYLQGDTYTQTQRAAIAALNYAQYNGAKDRGGSLFVYDTQMNDADNPANSWQIETLHARYYVEDYVYVYVRNTLQAAGMPGVPNDDTGIQLIKNLVKKALDDCFSVGLILATESGASNFTVGALTAAQVSVLDPNWQVTGVWPSGVITARVKLFSAAHYIVLNFNF